MNRRYSLRYILAAAMVFCLTRVVGIWQSDSGNDQYYQPSNTNVALYHTQCANPPTVPRYISDHQPCYIYQTNMRVYWTNGHYSTYTGRQSPAGYMASVQEQIGVDQVNLLDLSRKDIRPDSGTGLAEVWQGDVTKIVLHGQTIKTYEDPELNFAKDAHHGTIAMWVWAGLAVICGLILLAAESARSWRSGAGYP